MRLPARVLVSELPVPRDSAAAVSPQRSIAGAASSDLDMFDVVVRRPAGIIDRGAGLPPARARTARACDRAAMSGRMS